MEAHLEERPRIFDSSVGLLALVVGVLTWIYTHVQEAMSATYAPKDTSFKAWLNHTLSGVPPWLLTGATLAAMATVQVFVMHRANVKAWRERKAIREKYEASDEVKIARSLLRTEDEIVSNGPRVSIGAAFLACSREFRDGTSEAEVATVLQRAFAAGHAPVRFTKRLFKHLGTENLVAMAPDEVASTWSPVVFNNTARPVPCSYYVRAPEGTGVLRALEEIEVDRLSQTKKKA